MATYTSFLNLEKPTTSETFNLLKLNQNWDKIDQGVSSLNSNMTAQNILLRGTSLAENTDMNNVKTIGRYSGVPSTFSNLPTGVSSKPNIDLIVMQRGIDSRVWQIMFVYSDTPEMWIRAMSSANDFTNWVKVG